uniref:hypothetical protein n=1 Tax=Candidatus Wunengus sp. YC65 TaxID=3367701 RepID=UPI00402914D8
MRLKIAHHAPKQQMDVWSHRSNADRYDFKRSGTNHDITEVSINRPPGGKITGSGGKSPFSP